MTAEQERLSQEIQTLVNRAEAVIIEYAKKGVELNPTGCCPFWHKCLERRGYTDDPDTKEISKT